MMNSTIFSSPTFGQMNLSGVVDRAVSFIESENNCTFKIVVGTDSELIPHGGTHFVTAIVVHHVGHGGVYFWSSISKTKIKDLRQRMYEEASQSLAIAQNLIEEFKKRDQPLDKILEIHVDIGQNGDTRNMIAEITGMIRGSGFVCKTKPESFGASNVADRHT
ncbi:MAG: ribonuclease H-like YkuK family protein [bacterium]|nr:ribonuclease H-like YkuK family protein [bacterium]